MKYCRKFGVRKKIEIWNAPFDNLLPIQKKVDVLYLCYRSSWKYGKQLTPGRRVMLVIGHPDDEVMFFGPTILGLVQVPFLLLLGGMKLIFQTE